MDFIFINTHTHTHTHTYIYIYRERDLILVQYHHNNCTTTLHMRVDPSVWDPPSCEGLLYSCCIGVVNLTFSIYIYIKAEFQLRVGLELGHVT